ncbi:MAG: hypothetical protein E3J30_00150 [Anaerolineales bacterium]|nr:MAG: hypothetical protein E3J30_00150 [Anaerolineales bacterium]
MKTPIDGQLENPRIKSLVRGVRPIIYWGTCEYAFLLYPPFSQRWLTAQTSDPPVDRGFLIATIVALAVSLGLAFLLGHMNRDE